MKGLVTLVILTVALEGRLFQQQAQYRPSQPPRKLMYVVDKAKNSPSLANKGSVNPKRTLEQKPMDSQAAKLHLNKSFVVSRGHMEKLRKLTEQKRSPKLSGSSVREAHHSHHSHSRRLTGGHHEKQAEHKAHGGLELEDNHKQLQSTPLLLIGDYEIIVEKKDDI